MRELGTRDEWRRRIRDFDRSGLSARDYAAQIGVSAKSISRWRARFRGEPKPTFVEVHATAAAGGFEVELVSGRRVRVPEQFDDDALARLIAVLEGAS
jgi:transposase